MKIQWPPQRKGMFYIHVLYSFLIRIIISKCLRLCERLLLEVNRSLILPKPTAQSLARLCIVTICTILFDIKTTECCIIKPPAYFPYDLIYLVSSYCMAQPSVYELVYLKN